MHFDSLSETPLHLHAPAVYSSRVIAIANFLSTMYILFAFLLFSTRHHRNGVVIVIFVLGPGIMSVGGRLTLHRRLLLYIIIVVLCSAAMLFCSFIRPLSCLLPLKWSIIQSQQQLHGATPSHSFLSCCYCSSYLVFCSAIRSLLPLTACLSLYIFHHNELDGAALPPGRRSYFCSSTSPISVSS